VFGWGILGTGDISASFVEGLAHAPGAGVAAVASRDAGRAEAFRVRSGALRAHVEVEALANDPDVDIVYIGTPHVRHASDALTCIEAGKSVLVEKPMATSAADAAAIFSRAQARGVLVMEAMWTRFFPAMDQIFEIAKDVELLQADFGFSGDRSSEPRLFDPAYAGGAILDVGVYPLWLAIGLLGPPIKLAAAGHIGPTGVDERAGMTLTHASGALSVISCAITADTASEATIYGPMGTIRIDMPWWRPSRYRIGAKTFEAPYLGNGYAHEAIEMMRCLSAGERESPRLPHAVTLDVLRAADLARKLI